MNYNHSHHQHQNAYHGHGAQPQGFLDTHGMSQWATRRAGDLADMRDPQPGALYGAPAERMHPVVSEADLGAIAVNQVVPEQYR